MGNFKTPSVEQLQHVDSTSSTLENVNTSQSQAPTIVASTSNGIPQEMHLKEAVKLYPKVTRYTFFLMSAILLYGYDLVIVGTIPAVPGFQKDFGALHGDQYIIPAMWMSLWSALGPTGALIGAIIAGWVQDRIGRRRCLAIASVLSAVAVAVVRCAVLPLLASYIPDTPLHHFSSPLRHLRYSSTDRSPALRLQQTLLHRHSPGHLPAG
jgi:hypothetical protein